MLPVRDLESIAIENAVEGCVRETFGALLATFQARTARDPDIARAMRRIARDETRHAELAWQVAGWIAPKLSPEARGRVDAARRRAAADLRKALAFAPSPAVVRAAGMPTPAQAAILFDAMAEHVLAA